MLKVKILFVGPNEVSKFNTAALFESKSRIGVTFKVKYTELSIHLWLAPARLNVPFSSGLYNGRIIEMCRLVGGWIFLFATVGM